MFFFLCFTERASSLFSSVFPLSPTYVTHTHTGWKNEETGFVFASFQLRVPCGALPDVNIDTQRCIETRHRNIEINLRMCMHPCAQMNRWAYTHADTQMFIPKQIHTRIDTSSFPLSQQVCGDFGVDKKKKNTTVNFPSSFHSGCDSDWPFSCGHAKTMSAWVAINLWAAFIKNTATLLPQHVYLTWVTGRILLQTQVMPSAPLPLLKLSKQVMQWGDRVLSFTNFAFLDSGCFELINEYFHLLALYTI